MGYLKPKSQSKPHGKVTVNREKKPSVEIRLEPASNNDWNIRMCAKVLFPFLLALPVKSVSTLNRLALMPRLLCLPCLCQLHAGASASCYCQQMASCQLHPSPPARTSAEPAKLLSLSSAHNFSPRPVLVAWLSLWCQVSKAALTHLMSAVPYLCLVEAQSALKVLQALSPGSTLSIFLR